MKYRGKGKHLEITLKEVALPDFTVTEPPPAIGSGTYVARCDRAYATAHVDWLVVYGDREHYANLVYLTNFDPRFEEAILLLGPDTQRALLVGNEGLSYAGQARLPLDVLLCQSLSLMGQDRSRTPRIGDVLRDAGIGAGQRVGVVGWKYLAPEETNQAAGLPPQFFAPSVLVDTLRGLVGDATAVTDATPVLMHPVTGLRTANEPEQIAAFEWGAARASASVWNIMRGVHPGMSEYEAVAQMGYAGDTLAAHVLFNSGRGEIVGLRSPTARVIADGDGITTAVAHWGGLCARAGLVAVEDTAFVERVAIPYYRGTAAWYGTVRVAATGGEIFTAVTDALAAGGLRSALNPGHLTGHDEWIHSPITLGNTDRLTSGMAFQCDIIPTPLPDGWTMNGEDTVVFADATLRETLARQYPALWGRITARQAFMRNQLGLTLSDDVLPLSIIPAYLPPCWLRPYHVLTVA